MSVPRGVRHDTVPDMEASQATQDQRELLERFIVENPSLERLGDLLAEFNLFQVLGIETNEIRHSAFLAWLLDPGTSHGLGAYFLRKFLSIAAARGSAHEIGSITPPSVDRWKLGSSRVETERHHIDILITDEEDGLVVAIENKIYSSEHGNQLARYRQAVEQNYPGLSPLYIFLTVDGDQPYGEEDASYYVPMSYGDVAEMITQTLGDRSTSLAVDVRAALTQYVGTLRRRLLSDSEIQQLARSIYFSHKAAIDLIIDAIPDTRGEIRSIVESVMASVGELDQDGSNKSFIRYFDPRWDQISQLGEGKRWTNTGRMLLFEFRNLERSLNLNLVLGPGPEVTRQRVFDLAQRHGEPLQAQGRLGDSWKFIYSKQILSGRDYDDPELESIRTKVETAVAEFREHDLDGIIEAIAAEFA